jgi:hypothetical protein
MIIYFDVINPQKVFENKYNKAYEKSADIFRNKYL